MQISDILINLRQEKVLADLTLATARRKTDYAVLDTGMVRHRDGEDYI
jgi:hypothetical protein